MKISSSNMTDILNLSTFRNTIPELGITHAIVNARLHLTCVINMASVLCLMELSWGICDASSVASRLDIGARAGHITYLRIIMWWNIVSDIWLILCIETSYINMHSAKHDEMCVRNDTNKRFWKEVAYLCKAKLRYTSIVSNSDARIATSDTERITGPGALFAEVLDMILYCNFSMITLLSERNWDQ